MFFIEKKKTVKIINVWFDSIPENSIKKNAIYTFNDLREPLILDSSYIISRRNAETLISDLRAGEEELLSICKSNVRNEIRRSKREGVICHFYSSEIIARNKDIIMSFQKAYDEMHESKKMKKVNVVKTLDALLCEGNLFITTATINDIAVAIHVYIVDKTISRLLYSVSIFRNSNLPAASIGRANRFLHYCDMIHFKNLGITIYDWGGFSKGLNYSTKNIDSFKAGFGGTIAPSYYYTVTRNKVYYAILKLLIIIKQK